MKYRRGILLGFFLVLLYTVGLYSESELEDRMETAADAVSETNTGKSYVSVAGHEIALWQQGGQFYAFLPSACREMDLQPEIPEETAPDSIVWMYSENIPAVFIDTKSGSRNKFMRIKT